MIEIKEYESPKMEIARFEMRGAVMDVIIDPNDETGGGDVVDGPTVYDSDIDDFEPDFDF